MLNKNIFSERLKILRINQNLSQETLAGAIGLTKQAISMIESSQRSVSSDVLVNISDYFDVSIDYLVGRSDDPIRH